MQKSPIRGIPTGVCSGEKQPESANEFGVKGYPLAPTIDSLSVNGVTAYETIDYAIVR